jgi:hypothetical protein
MVDGNRPIVAGHVPVELGVTFSGDLAGTIEETDAVADRVIDVDYARRVDRSGKVDFEIAVGSGLAGIVLQLVSALVGDADDFEKERVVRSLRSGILDGNGAVNSVPLADEGQRDLFADQGGAIGRDRDGVLEIGDAPVAGLGGGGRGEREE